MANFQQRHQGFRVRIGETRSAEAVAKAEVDIAILRAVSVYEALRCDLVFEEQGFPVGAPALLDLEPLDLDSVTMLVAGDEPLWAAWLQQDGAPQLSRRIDMKERSLAIRAAIAGRGLAKGSTLNEAAELADHRLRPAFWSFAIKGPAAYYAVYPPGRADCPAEKAFLDWLRPRPAHPHGQVPAQSGQRIASGSN